MTNEEFWDRAVPLLMLFVFVVLVVAMTFTRVNGAVLEHKIQQTTTTTTK